MPLPGTPREVLSGLGELTRRVRAAQRDAWIPLLLFGLLTLGAVVVGRLTFRQQDVPCPGAPAAPGETCTAMHQGSPAYWTVGLLAAYAATAWWYLRRSRQRGVGSPVRPYALAGVAAVAALAATAWWGAGQPAPGADLRLWGLQFTANATGTLLLQHFLGGAAAIGVPLLVLARIERNGPLALFALGYLLLELLPVTFGWWGAAAGPWSGLARYGVSGLYLLAGALLFARAAHRTRPQADA
ncbi:hypothetical protein KSE_02140 [Kitasatospora setae KM-6054]|uniref:DUF998 domain-containing protein n=1 Tax=Kitasatospora setae (strain ATCC 33774 / DSM 43861 / JCM 3304 / KCC A-0304 / NBRC 14216 / KM-6054) TaxID=452652 RepID=E4N4D3_KITSK|nr:hypothetical protein KSE_02140 [Kitasatospora setae KM-6054]